MSDSGTDCDRGAGNGPSPSPQDRLHDELSVVWGNPRGWRALSIVNHTTIGLRFMATGLVFFVIGGMLAMLIRAQLALPGGGPVDHAAYNQLFTMHGTVMMFLFAVPMLEGLAMYLIPKMIGARDLVFPRLSAFGYWCYLFGGTIVVSSLALGLAPSSGWFMYTPLSSGIYSPGPNSDFWLLGITFVEISAVSAGVELAVSILRTRTSGMALHLMPLFAWYILVTAIMIIVGFPPLILGSVLLELERAVGMPFFDVALGGDPVLWQHLFWLFGHPEVYILFLPAAGIVSTLLPVFCGRPVVGYRWLVLSVITTGFISFGLWVHHMFTIGIPHLAQAFFSAASMLVAIPTGIQIFAWLATLWLGRPRLSLPMLWILGFLVIFVAGGLTGVMLALVPFNWQVHDTHFVVAHMHYVLVGGMLFPLMAGLYYWLPLASGRMPSERIGVLGFWLVFTGFNLTFLIMHWTGLLGMPRRVYTYDAGLGWDVPNLVSSLGAFVLAIGTALVLVDLLLHFRLGRRAKANPWGADTLEWATRMPPSPYNFVSLPECATRHPMWEQPDLPREIAEGRHALSTADHGRRETWGSDPLTGQIREIIHLPGNSWWPFYTALALAITCVALLLRIYVFAGVAAIGALALLLAWSWENGAHPSAAPDAQVQPGDPPLHSRTFDGPGLWGMGITLLANGAFYLALLFGWFYLWTVAPNWQSPPEPPVSLLSMLIIGAILSIGGPAFQRVLHALRREGETPIEMRLWAIALLGFVHLGALVALTIRANLAPAESAHDAVFMVMLFYLIVHGGLAAILTLLQALRVRIGYVGHLAPYELTVVAQFWWYTIAVFWISVLALLVFPMTWVTS